VLDCLAASYAENKQYALAAETIAKAIELAQSVNEPQKVMAFREREKQYLQNLPWRSEKELRR